MCDLHFQNADPDLRKMQNAIEAKFKSTFPKTWPLKVNTKLKRSPIRQSWHENQLIVRVSMPTVVEFHCKVGEI